MNWSIRSADFFPILDGAGKNISNLVPRQAGNRVVDVDDYRHAVSANDILVELDPMTKSFLLFGISWRARSSGDIAQTASQCRQPVPGRFRFKVEIHVRMFLLVDHHKTRSQLFPKRVRASDD